MRYAYFFVLFVVSMLSFRWLYRAARASAGVSFEEETRYYHTVRHMSHRNRHVSRWLVRRSEQPGKTRLLLNLYTLSAIPSAMCMVFSPVPALKTVIDIAAVVLPVWVLAGAVAGRLYAKRDPFYLPLKEKWRIHKRIAIDEEVEEFYKDKEGPRWKHNLIGLGKLVAVIAVMVGIVLLIVNSGKKLPVATDQQVNEAFQRRGYTVADETEHYRRVWDAQQQVLRVLTAQGDQINVEFFRFDTDRSAQNVHGQLIQKLREVQDMSEYTEYTLREGNFSIYALEVRERYYMNIRVGATALYGYCAREQAAELKAFAQELGYFA